MVNPECLVQQYKYSAIGSYNNPVHYRSSVVKSKPNNSEVLDTLQNKHGENRIIKRLADRLISMQYKKGARENKLHPSQHALCTQQSNRLGTVHHDSENLNSAERVTLSPHTTSHMAHMLHRPPSIRAGWGGGGESRSSPQRSSTSLAPAARSSTGTRSCTLRAAAATRPSGSGVRAA
eukprot:6210583-Pleurochrysis_carterae.AAC.1